MFLTIASPGDELSYLLFKHPGRVQDFDLAFGRATIFYPRADRDITEVALLVDVDSAGLARSKRFRVSGFELGHHINDRAYAASSLLAVALGRVFRSALTGRDSDDHPGSAGRERELAIHLPSVRSRGGAALVRELFEPLGWLVDAVETVPTCVDVRLKGRARLANALSQLYVLLPVLDDSKHYWVGEAEIGKLVRYGEDWLADHPARDLISARYLAHQSEYVADATALLLGPDGEEDLADSPEDQAELAESNSAGRLGAADRAPAAAPAGVRAGEQAAALSGGAPAGEQAAAPAGAPDEAGPVAADGLPPSLGAQRTDYLAAKLSELGARRVLDLGCGEGRLVRRLLDRPGFEVVGADVSATALARAAKRLERLPERQRQRATLIQASATYRDARFQGFDAVVASEVIEHLDGERLPAVEAVLFGAAKPRHVILTTPNAEFNAVYGIEPNELRHADHRFEWTRAQFQGWARAVAHRNGYRVEFDGIGPVHDSCGQPTQVAWFERGGEPERRPGEGAGGGPASEGKPGGAGADRQEAGRGDNG
ncbi:MAG: methyltransferase [Bifidobacteriaceae bacterium]|nr:methyltransferase [Bifidobacteriaceae bacterium]